MTKLSQRLHYFLDLTIVLTQKELKVRYKNSFLGYLWSIANPLAFACVFYIAFKVIMKIKMEDYPLFIVAGLFPWQWFSNSITASSTVFPKNTSIIKKVAFSKNFLPLAAVLDDLTHFVCSIPIIFLLLFIYGRPFGWPLLYGIPLLLGIQLLMTYGLCLTLSSLTLFFRDLERLNVVFVMLLFYFTPIVYSESMIPGDYRFLIYYNPMALTVINWRNLFFNQPLDPSFVWVSLGYSLLSLAIGHLIYNKLCWKFAEIV